MYQGSIKTMYLLVRIELNDVRSNMLISERKNKLEKYLKEKGFYWSKINGAYIDDKNNKTSNGSGADYIIEKIDKI